MGGTPERKKMIIRTVKKTDYRELLNIYSPYVENTTVSFELKTPTTEEWTERLDGISSRFPFLVAEENGRILGYAYLSSFHGRAAYNPTCDLSVYCLEGQTGKGIGLKLYSEIEKLAVERGFYNIVSIITEENKGSVAFHEKIGFNVIGFFPRVAFKHNKWLGCYFMMKAIRDGNEAPDIKFKPTTEDYI